MDEETLTEIQKKLEEIGPKFCAILSKAELEQMKKFMDQYEKGEIYPATRTLESLDFLHTVASKICVREKE